LEEFFEVPIDFGQPAMSLTFSSSDLETPNPCPVSARDTLTLSDVGTFLGGAQPNSTVEFVAEIVRMRLYGGLTGIEGAARHMCLGVRTLQRHLTVEGVSYRTIVARERYRRALDLLSETALSVTEIATALGYAYTSDLTRSFTRNHGQPPTKIRRANSMHA
jgi:AraC-like DNA-binding protein